MKYKHREHCTDLNYTAWQIFTKCTHTCDQHPDQEIEHYKN